MRPDDDRVVPFEARGSDPELDALADALSRAGSRTHAEPAQRASLAFTSELRTRLLSAYPAGAYIAPSAQMLDTGMQPVVPHVERTTPAVLPRWRWPLLAAAAAIVIAVAGLQGRTFLTLPPEASAVAAIGATLERAGTMTELQAGMEILAGDRVATAATGSATLSIAAGEVRLAGDTVIAIVDLAADAVELSQFDGRAWHRVGPTVDRYRVATAEVSWTATGTAFDLDRRTAGDGREEVRAIGIEHDVRISAPDLSATLAEGSIALIALGEGGAPRLDLGPVSPDELASAWLLQNATRDVALGFDPGILHDVLADSSPTPTPEAPTDAEPAETPSTESPTDATEPPAREATAKPTAKPSAKPTPKPTAKPTPTPKPTPGLASLSLDVTACPGGFAWLAWSKAPASDFNHYQTIRSTSETIKPVYPPKPPGVAPDGLYGTDRSWLSALDDGLEPGESYSYRTMAFDADDTAYAASSVETIAAKDVKGLGGLDATVEGGALTVAWTPYSGPEACYTWYKLVASITDESPSYLDGAPYIWAGESQGADEATIEGLDPGTYHLRLETLRDSEAGPILVARTEVATVTIP